MEYGDHVRIHEKKVMDLFLCGYISGNFGELDNFGWTLTPIYAVNKIVAVLLKVTELWASVRF